MTGEGKRQALGTEARSRTAGVWFAAAAYGNQNIPHGCGDEVKAQGWSLLLSLPFRCVRSYKAFPTPSTPYPLSSASRELTNTHWRLVCFWFWWNFILYLPLPLFFCWLPLLSLWVPPPFTHCALVMSQTSTYIAAVRGIASKSQLAYISLVSFTQQKFENIEINQKPLCLCIV